MTEPVVSAQSVVAGLEGESEFDVAGLPTLYLVGSEERVWELPVDGDGVVDTIEFRGTFLGLGSTHRPLHRIHPGQFANPAVGEKCMTCRWFELRLFWDDDTDTYVLHYAGRTVVPGESQRLRVERAVTAYELIEILIQGGQLTYPANRALGQAAEFDEAIEKAFKARKRTL